MFLFFFRVCLYCLACDSYAIALWNEIISLNNLPNFHGGTSTRALPSKKQAQRLSFKVIYYISSKPCYVIVIAVNNLHDDLMHLSLSYLGSLTGNAEWEWKAHELQDAKSKKNKTSRKFITLSNKERAC